MHECAISLPPPTKTPTPYGGKLTWTLPGECKMVVHLKDKQKIRHKKRWSQVIYSHSPVVSLPRCNTLQRV